MFFLTILGFVESYSGVLGDIEGFFQLIPGNYKSDKPINITGNDKIHLKRDGINGSIVNGIREPILCNFALDQPAIHEKYKETGVKLFKKIKETVLSDIKF